MKPKSALLIYMVCPSLGSSVLPGRAQDHITLEDYEIHDGMGLEMYYN